MESDESRRFAGEIETLNGHLKPIKSEDRICQLLSKSFYGRQWLFEAVEKWRKETKLDRPSGSESRLFWIMGAPGDSLKQAAEVAGELQPMAWIDAEAR